MVRLFRDIRGVQESGARFSWLYHDNPAGAARIWILKEPSGEPVGFTSGYPRAFWVDGEVVTALNCGDFSVAAGHRSLGPALMLRRPAKSLVDAGVYAFLYAHPLPAMLAVHRRVGHAQLSTMERWVYPLRAGAILERRLGRGLARLLAPVADSGLRARRILQGTRGRRFDIQEVDDFSADYDDLDLELGQQYPVIGRRTASFLRWRFLRQPAVAATVLEARRSVDGVLVGYLVSEPGVPTAKVRDMACIPGLGVERALLLAAARRAAATGAQSLNVVVQKAFPGTPALQSLGFWERDEEQATVSYGGAGFFGKARVEDVANWYMTIGDRDI
ncbi:MAG: hypothetical protein JSU87_18185 [Gemmatimonadota bacterium]|nr:MAG: hypothetical protein JSU87_18185 [Gemmatimonadota bacterium]